jgi:hypothetical protein
MGTLVTQPLSKSLTDTGSAYQCNWLPRLVRPLGSPIALTKFQMAPHNEQSMEAISSKDFFTNVSKGGYPRKYPKAQPWKNIWTGTQGKETKSDGKLIVACALRHDYGMAPHHFFVNKR